MTERPILFSAPMVRAILAGTKTQTRRAVKPQPEAAHEGEPYWFVGGYRVWAYRPAPPFPLRCGGNPLSCPYGARGDRLWVREAFRFTDVFDCDSPARVGERCIDAGYRKPWAPTQFEADSARLNWQHTGTPPNDGPPRPGKLRPGMFMPRWASRITLEVTGVRVERLQDISAADCISEGIGFEVRYGGHCLPDGSHFHGADPRVSFWSLWDSINGEGSVAANPWVWCISFRRIWP